jgi:hypothetical protein
VSGVSFQPQLSESVKAEYRLSHVKLLDQDLRLVYIGGALLSKLAPLENFRLRFSLKRSKSLFATLLVKEALFSP